MNYDFNVTDLLNPIVNRFNGPFISFVDEVKKRISYYEKEDYSSPKYHSNESAPDEKYFIEKIIIGRTRNSEKRTIEFYPKTNGRFGFKLLKDIQIEYEVKDISITIFLFDDRGEGISKVNNFFNYVS